MHTEGYDQFFTGVSYAFEARHAKPEEPLVSKARESSGKLELTIALLRKILVVSIILPPSGWKLAWNHDVASKQLNASVSLWHDLLSCEHT